MTSGHEEVDDVVATLTDQIDQIENPLEGFDPDTSSMLSVMLGTNYAQHIYTLRMYGQSTRTRSPTSLTRRWTISSTGWRTSTSRGST